MALWFVTGVDTGIGKTVVSSALAAGLCQAGIQVLALKPFETGCSRKDGRLEGEDARTLAMAAGRPDAETGLYRYEVPLAPSVAARLEGPDIDLDAARRWVLEHAREVDQLIVEGVGGLMVPLTASATVLDWIRLLEPDGVVLVARNRLGVLSQVLTASYVLKTAVLPLRGVVLNAPEGEAGIAEQTNADELERWVSPVVPFPLLTEPGTPGGNNVGTPSGPSAAFGPERTARLATEGARAARALGILPT